MIEYTHAPLRKYSVGTDKIAVYPDKVIVTTEQASYNFILPSAQAPWMTSGSYF